MAPDPDPRPDPGTEALPWQTPVPGLRLLRRAQFPIRRIQVYGQRCSGTNTLIRLVEANFPPDTFTELYGFKHWFVPEQVLVPPDVLVLVIARDAHEWLRSLHRKPWHLAPHLKALGFSEFIRTPWHSVWDDEFWGVDASHPIRDREMLHERDPATGGRFPNPVAKRTAKLRHWAALHERVHNLGLLSYAALRRDPRAIIDSLAAAAGLSAAVPFRPIDSYKGQGERLFVPTPSAPLSDSDCRHVARWLCPRVEDLYGT